MRSGAQKKGSGQNVHQGDHRIDFVARPSFSFPFVKPPNMIPNVDESILWTEFGPDRDQANIPQPWPLWIKNINEKDFVKPSKEK